MANRDIAAGEELTAKYPAGHGEDGDCFGGMHRALEDQPCLCNELHSYAAAVAMTFTHWQPQ